MAKKKKKGDEPGKEDSTKEKKEGAPDKDEPEESEDFKYIVRLAETDIDGHKSVELALTKVRGIGRRTAIILSDTVGIPRTKRIGDLDDDQIEELSEAIAEYADHVPSWMVNRQRDIETGEDLHLNSSTLASYLRDDINRLKKIRCYRGIRHERGKKVRGQRTKSNGRKGLTLGVLKAGKGGTKLKEKK